MENTTQMIEEYLKSYFKSEPTISEDVTDILATSIVIQLKKDLSDTMLNCISKILSPIIVKAMLDDYIEKNNKR